MSATLVTPKTTSGGEIIRELVNSTDGQGLHLSDGGTIVLTNAAGAEFGTSDFSLEFILDQDQDNSSENYIYFSHDSGNSRIRFRHDPGSDAAILTFINSSGAAEDYTLAYDMTGDYGTPTHYALSCDRSGNAVLYKNGDSVASVSIAASSTVDIGASNTSTGNIGYTAGLGAIGTFYRFRTWNKALTAAEVTDTYENATVKFADQWGSQTIVIPGDFTGNLDGWDAYNDWNSQTNPSNNMVLAASAVGQHCRNSATMTDGKRYRCTYTASATTGNPYFAHNRGSVAAITADVGSSTITNGTNSFEFTQTGTGGNGYAYVKAAGATDAVTLDDISIVEIGVVADYDLAFANPTQSRAVQDRAGAADGTSSASGVKQLTPIDGVNTNKLNIGGTTPKLGLGLAAGETPTHEVLIAGASNPAIQICDTDHGVSTSDGLLLQQAGVDSYVWNYETGKLWLGTSNTARLTIDSNGLLTASGASTVDDLNTSAKIYNSAANTCGLQLVDNAGKACIQTSSGSLQIWTDSETQGNNFVAGDLAMTINSAGQILVGSGATTEKVTKLGGGAEGITVGAALPCLALWDTDNADHVTYLGNAGGNAHLGTATASPIYFQPGGVTKVSIDSAGKIEVNPTGRSYGGKIVSASSAAGTATLSAVNEDTSGTRRLIDFFAGTSTSRIAYIETDGTALNIGGCLTTVERPGWPMQNLLTNSGFGVWSNGTLENVTGTELVTNGGFASNTTGWSFADCTGASVAGGVSGNCLEITHSGSGGDDAYQALTSVASLVVGKLYKVSAYVKSGSSGDQGFVIGAKNNAGSAWVNSVSGTSSSSWTNYTVVFEATETNNNIWLRKNTTTAGTMLFDAVSCVEVTPGCVAADALGPDGWTKHASGREDIRRVHWTGTGGDSDKTKAGAFYSMEIEKKSASNGNVKQSLGLSERFAGRTVTFGAWVKTDDASFIKLYITDGVGTSYSDPHSGDNTWEWLEVTHAMNASTSDASVAIQTVANDTKFAYVSQPMAVIGSAIGEGNYSAPPGEIVYFENAVDSNLLNAKTGANGFSDVSMTTLNNEADSNGSVPKGVKAIMVNASVNDSGSAGDSLFFATRADAAQEFSYMLAIGGIAADREMKSSGWSICNNDGDFQYQINASGSNTFDIGRFHYIGVELR
jgi:hypothetical protein